MNKSKKKYVSATPGTLVILPVQDMHIDELRSRVGEAKLLCSHLTEVSIIVEVPHGKECEEIRRIKNLSFVRDVHRHIPWDPVL